MPSRTATWFFEVNYDKFTVNYDKFTVNYDKFTVNYDNVAILVIFSLPCRRDKKKTRECFSGQVK